MFLVPPAVAEMEEKYEIFQSLINHGLQNLPGSF